MPLRPLVLLKDAFYNGGSREGCVVVSLDAFEHFADPQGVLRIMRGLIKDNGCAMIVFGPTWFHPLGGHFVFNVSLGASDIYRKSSHSMALRFYDG